MAYTLGGRQTMCGESCDHLPIALSRSQNPPVVDQGASTLEHTVKVQGDLPRKLSEPGVPTTYDLAHQRSDTTDWRETSTKVQLHQHGYLFYMGRTILFSSEI